MESLWLSFSPPKEKELKKKKNLFDSHEPTDVHARFVFSNGVSVETAGLDDCAYLFWGGCSLHWVSFDLFLILWLSHNSWMHGWQSRCQQQRHQFTSTGSTKKNKALIQLSRHLFIFLEISYTPVRELIKCLSGAHTYVAGVVPAEPQLAVSVS